MLGSSTKNCFSGYLEISDVDINLLHLLKILLPPYYVSSWLTELFLCPCCSSLSFLLIYFLPYLGQYALHKRCSQHFSLKETKATLPPFHSASRIVAVWLRKHDTSSYRVGKNLSWPFKLTTLGERCLVSTQEHDSSLRSDSVRKQTGEVLPIRLWHKAWIANKKDTLSCHNSMVGSYVLYEAENSNIWPLAGSALLQNTEDR